MAEAKPTDLSQIHNHRGSEKEMEKETATGRRCQGKRETEERSRSGPTARRPHQTKRRKKKKSARPLTQDDASGGITIFSRSARKQGHATLPADTSTGRSLYSGTRSSPETAERERGRAPGGTWPAMCAAAAQASRGGPHPATRAQKDKTPVPLHTSLPTDSSVVR